MTDKSIGIVQEWFERFLALIGFGKGFTYPFTTSGKGTPQPVPIDFDHLVAAMTIQNNGTTTLYWGANGIPSVPLLGGTSTTLRWKNPHQYQLAVMDSGSPISVSVWS